MRLVVGETDPSFSGKAVFAYRAKSHSFDLLQPASPSDMTCLTALYDPRATDLKTTYEHVAKTPRAPIRRVVSTSGSWT